MEALLNEIIQLARGGVTQRQLLSALPDAAPAQVRAAVDKLCRCGVLARGKSGAIAPIAEHGAGKTDDPGPAATGRAHPRKLAGARLPPRCRT